MSAIASYELFSSKYVDAPPIHTPEHLRTHTLVSCRPLY